MVAEGGYSNTIEVTSIYKEITSPKVWQLFIYEITNILQGKTSILTMNIQALINLICSTKLGGLMFAIYNFSYSKTN